jgi:ABC-type glycerol-3-phosphate transport system permease component
MDSVGSRCHAARRGAIAPILVVILFSQRALVSGMLAGATKE